MTTAPPTATPEPSTEKPRFPFHLAGPLSVKILDALRPCCAPDRCLVAGSLRRLKHTVGDIEIVYVPRFGEVKGESLFPATGDLAETEIEKWLAAGRLAKRQNVNGSVMWGPKNKLARHTMTRIPVDLFAATEANWFNYLVCRTGGAENNVQIASAAQRQGWKWNPYGPGFTDELGQIVPVRSEEEVYQLVGLIFRQPWDRP